MSESITTDLWKLACQSLQSQLSPSAYRTWIITNPLTQFEVIEANKAVGVISSPTGFHATNVEKNFGPQIKAVLEELTGQTVELQFQVGVPKIEQLHSVSQVASAPVQPEAITTTPVQMLQPVPVMAVETDDYRAEPEAELPVQAQIQSVETVKNQPMSPIISDVQERLKRYAETQQMATSPAATPSFSNPNIPQSSAQQTNYSAGELFSPTNIQSMTVDRALLQAQRTGLRLDYTFETFAVSTTNEMAHAAAMAVSGQPGMAYNPLFIYGGVGVGKTHLMHAVGNNILKNNPDTKILYCTGEDFTNEIVSAIQNKKALQFKEKFRTVDVLLIDDVQFIAGKNSVQEEFFHTFNTVTKRYGQVILTSDRPPQEIALLEDRLRSRFEAGLMVDIQQPSFELRTAILLIKANASHLQLPMNLAQIVASRVDSARKLEGIIKTLKSEVELKHRQIDSELIDEICKVDLDKPKQRLRVKPYDVIKIVADYYHIKQVIIKGPLRIKSVVRARHLAMYILKEDLQMPFVEIGRWFSNRDHTSAMHALRKVQQDLTEDLDLVRELNEIRQQLAKISK